MKFNPIEPPRTFEVGRKDTIEIKDCGRLELEANEQITLITESGAEYDLVRKSWGFYATPSLNGRLEQFGLRGVLVKSPAAKYYIWLVERGKEEKFQRYLEREEHEIITWLDDSQTLNSVEEKLTNE